MVEQHNTEVSFPDSDIRIRQISQNGHGPKLTGSVGFVCSCSSLQAVHQLDYNRRPRRMVGDLQSSESLRGVDGFVPGIRGGNFLLPAIHDRQLSWKGHLCHPNFLGFLVACPFYPWL